MWLFDGLGEYLLILVGFHVAKMVAGMKCLVDKRHDSLFFVASLEKSVVELLDKGELVFLIGAEVDDVVNLPEDDPVHNFRRRCYNLVVFNGDC
eukprot:9480304-Ditylum_brightwellii.AAC.1